MSYYLLKSKEVIIRKPHTCWGCAAIIVPGYPMQYCAGVFEGTFTQSYWCEVCHEFSKQFKEYFEDGVGFGEFRCETTYEKFRTRYLSPTRHVFIEKYKENPFK